MCTAVLFCYYKSIYLLQESVKFIYKALFFDFLTKVCFAVEKWSIKSLRVVKMPLTLFGSSPKNRAIS